MPAKFPPGRLLATPGVLDAVEAAEDDPLVHVSRHARGDWGTVGDLDKKLKDRALIEGTRLLSAYLLSDGTNVWIITEADRAATTVLLTEEY